MAISIELTTYTFDSITSYTLVFSLTSNNNTLIPVSETALLNFIPSYPSFLIYSHRNCVGT